MPESLEEGNVPGQLLALGPACFDMFAIGRNIVVLEMGDLQSIKKTSDSQQKGGEERLAKPADLLHDGRLGTLWRSRPDEYSFFLILSLCGASWPSLGDLTVDQGRGKGPKLRLDMPTWENQTDG